MRVKRRNACILQTTRRHKYEMWRFTISPEIDYGERCGSAIAIVSKFSSLCHAATAALRNR
jgi:hypothetical protein